MVKTLRESKAKLSELVDRASKGEDVLITVRGKVKARLTNPGAPQAGQMGASWAKELRSLQRSMSVPSKPRLTVEEILADDRGDRV